MQGVRGSNPLSSTLHQRRSARSCPNVLTRFGSVSAALAPLDRGHELSAEIWDVGHYAAPHEVAVAEGGLVHPGRARVHQIVLDAQAAGGALAVHDAGRDPDQASMADQADDLALVVGLADQVCDRVVA